MASTPTGAGAAVAVTSLCLVLVTAACSPGLEFRKDIKPGMSLAELLRLSGGDFRFAQFNPLSPDPNPCPAGQVPAPSAAGTSPTPQAKDAGKSRGQSVPAPEPSCRPLPPLLQIQPDKPGTYILHWDVAGKTQASEPLDVEQAQRRVLAHLNGHPDVLMTMYTSHLARCSIFIYFNGEGRVTRMDDVACTEKGS